MPLKTRAQARRYIREVARLMGLDGWTIRVDDDPPSDASASASVYATYGRKMARVWLSGAFFRADSEEQRYVCCHELLHCHHAQADRLVVDHLGEQVREAWSLAMEYAIDGVASGYARLLPLPK